MNSKSLLSHILPVGLPVVAAYVLLKLPETLIDPSLSKFAAMFFLVSAAMLAGKIRAAMIAYCVGLIVAWPSIANHILTSIQRPTGNCNGCYEIGSFFKAIITMATMCGFAVSLLPLGVMFWFFSRSSASK